jgi:hypothetical protein
LKLYMTVQHHINFQVDAQSSLIWCIYVNPVRDIMIYNSSFMLLLEDPPPWDLSFSLTRISRIQHLHVGMSMREFCGLKSLKDYIYTFET